MVKWLLRLNELKKIKSLSIIASGVPLLVPKPEAQGMINYLYDAVHRCKGIIVFNGAIIEKESVKYIDFGV